MNKIVLLFLQNMMFFQFQFIFTSKQVAYKYYLTHTSISEMQSRSFN